MNKMPPETAKIYNISAAQSFVDVLARGLLAEIKNKPEALAHTLILLPTRRACRTLQEAFLRQTEGAPLMLPRLQPLGDVDADELAMLMSGMEEASNAALDIPPALPSMKRQILLAQMISKLPAYSKGAEQDMALASALGQLMDEVYTEGLNLNDMPHLVDEAEFADHWQITINFLDLLYTHWPKILEEQGIIEQAQRRNMLMEALNSHWQKHPPQHPVIAAGTTGSIPATTALLKTISTHLPQGHIILPGLDKNMSAAAWDNVEEGHPQATLKILLNELGVEREQVKEWRAESEDKNMISIREKIISHVMTPPENTNDWQKISLHKTLEADIQKALSPVTLYPCATPQAEANVIALLLRETLLTPQKTAALITPDRQLARRVMMVCKRWGITLDDSAGQPLTLSTTGQYLRLCADMLVQNISPVSLLAFMKHSLNQGGHYKNFRTLIRALEKEILRGRVPNNGFAALRHKINLLAQKYDYKAEAYTEILEFLNFIEPIFMPALSLFQSGQHDFQKLLKHHLTLCENLCAADILWQGDSGEAAAEFFNELQDYAALIPPLSGEEYLKILDGFMAGISLRSKYGTHPRLMILGQLEARLVKVDRVILAGLNEGTWPPAPANDPWMSRPMRQKFGLPTAERAITLAAHDFVQGFCHAEVFITRAERSDGAPSVPSRWLLRLETFMKAIKAPLSLIEQPEGENAPSHIDLAALLDEAGNQTPIARPAPTPPSAARPKALSVTKIEKFLKDPYGIYAEKILKLRKLDPLEKPIDAAERGTIIHALMERFCERYPTHLPPNKKLAEQAFIEIIKETIGGYDYDPADLSFWMPRLYRLGTWVIEQESTWREDNNFYSSEIEGAYEFSEGLEHPFTLSARADRIDFNAHGDAVLIDYKSGGAYPKTQLISGALPQLPLEGVILNHDGFKGIKGKKTGALSYWKLTGGTPEGEITTLEKEAELEEAIETAQAGLLALIQIFEKQDTPYYAIPRLDNAPRYNDYMHLERVKEWAALGESENEGASYD